MFLAEFGLQAPGSWLCFSFLFSLLLLSLKVQLPEQWNERLTLFAWFLIPYLGLLAGGLSPRLMGLTDIDWLASLGFGSGLVFVMLLLLILVRATTESNSNVSRQAPPQQTSRPPLRAMSSAQPPFSVRLGQIITNGLEEFHWCFMRGAIWELIQTAPTPPSLPAYWAVWTAALLVAPEALLRQTTAAQRLFSLIVLIATTILFFYTRNFWLCWLLHVAAKFVINPRPIQLTSPSRQA